MKISLLCQKNEPVSIWGRTRSVAKLFGVNSRTVKYVWNRQTWGYATEHLWELESELQASSYSRRSKVVTEFQKRKISIFLCSRLILNCFQSANSGTIAHSDINLHQTTSNYPVDSNHNLENFVTFPCQDLSLEPECPSISAQLDANWFGKETGHHDPGYPQQQWINTNSSSWLDSLFFSDKTDPFHADWPYWKQEEISP